MLLTTLIERKRDGGRLTPDELRAFMSAYLAGELADYQMSAFLMAAFFQGLAPDELVALTGAMIESGTRLRFDDGGPPAVDKHSTGGVGDKVSLVLAPLLAEVGLRVPMMSGRGLGHTGGTLDKLEAIPGFEVTIDLDRFRAILDDVGCAMIGQTKEIAPLDGRLYALRDVTGTVPSEPLMAASIMSKKIAEGVQALVLDVKVGRGAFMTDPDRARNLAHMMIGLAESEGVAATALLTDMDVPLGRMVGNALEVREALDCLSGGGPSDLRDVTLALSAELLVSTGTAETPEAASQTLADALDSGRALERFARLVSAQGGDATVLEDPERLPAAPVVLDVTARGEGWFDVEPRGLGLAAIELGAGRRRAEDAVDPRVGFELRVTAGDRVAAGDLVARVHAADDASAERARGRLGELITFGEAPPETRPQILERVTKGG